MDKKIDNKKVKPEAPRIGGVDESAIGQPQYWPGDALLPPGKTSDGKETTTLPILPNHPTANGQ
jgi:hypothetical protein